MTKDEAIAQYPIHYRVWRSMVANNHSSQITPDWRGHYGFLTFIEDMSTPQSEHAKIKRMDNTAPYSKDNCYWATPAALSRTTQHRHNAVAKQSITQLRMEALTKKYPTLEEATAAMETMLDKQLNGTGLSYNESVDMDYLAEYISTLEGTQA